MKRVLHGGILRVEFARQVRFGDHGIMRRKLVALVTKRTDPDLGEEINARIGVEDSGTCPAAERSVRESRNVRVRADRSDGSGQGNDALAGFKLGAGPDVPCHPNAVNPFGIGVRHYPISLKTTWNQINSERLLVLGFFRFLHNSNRVSE